MVVTRERQEVVLVGTKRGIEMKLVPQAGLPLETLRVAGLKGKGGSTLLKNLFKLVPAMLDAARVFKNTNPLRRLALADMPPDRCCLPPGCAEFPM